MQKVKFGGNEYRVAFPALAICKLQDALGEIALSDIIIRLGQGKFDLKLWITVLWAGLLHEDSTLTFEDVTKIVDLKQNNEFMTSMAAVFKEFNESCEPFLVTRENSKNAKSPA
ncbi:MAG: hypothetical protein Q4E34_01030 [Synergistaceae bacterium]|nr:hypothetical protein [Synergistaceae bacterium]